MARGKSFGHCARFGLLVTITLLCVSGCVKATQHDSQTVYTFEPYIFLGALLASLAALPIGWFLRQKSVRVGWGMLILAPLFLVFVVPGLWSDFVKVDDQGFELKTGFWFAPTYHKVEFKNLASIALTDKIRSGRRGKQTSYDLQCQSPMGTGPTVPVGDLMKRALDDILAHAQAHGIAVMDQTDGQ